VDRQKEKVDNERLLSEARDPSFLSDLWDFMKTSKKWWMLPMILMLLLLSGVLVLSHTAMAPFIYSLF
jgi:protein-S-isoprenylcysteine O-methyltransferase Ste14